MSNVLIGERCTPCRRDSPSATEDEILGFKPLVPLWEINEVDGVPRLERAFRFTTDQAALAFTRRIGQAADQEDHHPVIVTEAKRVRVSWWTHAIHGLHRNDFVMAAKTDALFDSMDTEKS